MQKFKFIVIVIATILFSKFNLYAIPIQDRQAIMDSLTSLDQEIVQSFPRWRLCEPDLQRQIYLVFSHFYEDNKKLLDEADITLLAAPQAIKKGKIYPYEILLIKCGEISIPYYKIEKEIPNKLINILSGAAYYNSSKERKPNRESPFRDYCHKDMTPDIILNRDEEKAIINYLERPTDKTDAFVLSLYEQTLKIGKSDFWLTSKIGNDEIGYPFWSVGESKIFLQRPLYINHDKNTNEPIPNLINAYLGGVYKINSGLNNKKSLFSWLNNRILNSSLNGKLYGGFDFYMPFHPYFGMSLNTEIPFEEESEFPINESKYGYYEVNPLEVSFKPTSPVQDQITKVAPVLGSSGQISFFYNFWLGNNDFENYFRFDLGLSYYEINELAYYVDAGNNGIKGDGDDIHHLTKNDVNGLKMYKPNEFGDWVYLKAEYRNQGAYPFGLSFQYSNQLLLSRAYLPLFGKWLYLDVRYSTPLRGKRPYEIENMFMISPVLRLTI